MLHNGVMQLQVLFLENLIVNNLTTWWTVSGTASCPFRSIQVGKYINLSWNQKTKLLMVKFQNANFEKDHFVLRQVLSQG